MTPTEAKKILKNYKKNELIAMLIGAFIEIDELKKAKTGESQIKIKPVVEDKMRP